MDTLRMFDRLLRWLGSADECTENHVLCAHPGGLHRMAYTEWGEHDNPDVVVCVHGLTRNGRDFDDLARALSRRFRVVCPDVVGRGRSGWLRDPAGYGVPQYVADMMVLLARLDVEQVRWVGTSMGGLIGMAIASAENSPISRLVLNDVGPSITAASLQRIGQYVGNAPVFTNLAEAEAYLRRVNAPFGALTNAQWHRLAETSVRHRADGHLEMRYDPGIGAPFRQAFVMQDVDLWPLYDRINCPVLVTRGAESDLLAPDVARAMTERGPKAALIEFPHVGHAPMFLEPAQIAPVQRFLNS
jgi:pimeloyl-ACP methyl ester carboxylesterase